MHTKIILATLTLSTLAVAAPFPDHRTRGADPPTQARDAITAIESIFGSPFGNGNNDGNGNTAGSGNAGNGNKNGNGNGNNNGNNNVFGNGNDIGSGNSGLKIGRNNQASAQSLGDWVSGVIGSPFGNGNGDGNGNSAGTGNQGNGVGNGNNNGNGNGNGNQFGNGNSIGSGNSGLLIGKKVRKSETPGTYVGTIVDDVTGPLNPGSSNTIWTVGSPSTNGNENGSGNTAGSNNANNGNGNANNNGANNGNGNTFGNGNNILSGNCGLCSGVRVRQDDGFDPLPPQTVDALEKDFSQIFTDGPTDAADIIAGAVTGDDNQSKFAAGKNSRQVVGAVTDEIAQILSVVP